METPSMTSGVFWAALALYLLVFGVPLWMIVAKTGRSGAWSLIGHIPIINIGFLWWMALARWPSNER